MTPEQDRWIGRRVGAYEIVALIGSGGMGEVYRARRIDAIAGQAKSNAEIERLQGAIMR